MAVVPIIPKNNPIPVGAIEKALHNALTATAKAIQVDFNVTVQTWKKPSKFVLRNTRKKAGLFRLIYTTDKIYGYVNYGTRPHKIRPKNASRLAFQWGGPGSYSPKTTPNRIASSSGGSTGPMNYRQEVNHPGSKPRNFTKVIGKKWKKEWPINLARATAAALT